MDQKFNIEIDGVEKEAKVINVFEINGREFLIYSVDNGNETSDILYSEIKKDQEGFDQLIDVDDEEIKKNILELVKTIFS